MLRLRSMYTFTSNESKSNCPCQLIFEQVMSNCLSIFIYQSNARMDQSGTAAYTLRTVQYSTPFLYLILTLQYQIEENCFFTSVLYFWYCTYCTVYTVCNVHSTVLQLCTISHVCSTLTEYVVCGVILQQRSINVSFTLEIVRSQRFLPAEVRYRLIHLANSSPSFFGFTGQCIGAMLVSLLYP